MNINLHLHGPWRDISENGQMLVNMTEGENIQSLRQHILAIIDNTSVVCNKELMSVSAFAVKETLVGDDFRLSEGMEVHILPPVNGG